jgi:feruloyl esterase
MAADRAQINLTLWRRWSDGASRGAATDVMIAVQVTDYRVDITRPLCPHPKVAVYQGSGSTNDAASFECNAP